jgi:retron-type reverse transcriptase
MAKPSVSKPITMLINKTIENASFPNNLKEAQVVSLYKKNSQLDVGNYRPVSILPVVSRFFERAIYSRQLSQYFENIFHPFLSAFRPGFGCNTAPLKIIEDWKKAIDCYQYTAAVLVDLSKAFDCLPQDLLILKLEAYGLSKSALNLTHSYLSERKQCVKVGLDFSTWKHIYKGVPQGSIIDLYCLKYFLMTFLIL